MFCLPLKFLTGLLFQMPYNFIFNTFHKIFLHLDLSELLSFKQFSVQKSPTIAAIFKLKTVIKYTQDAKIHVTSI